MKKGRGLKIGVIGVGAMGQHHARICSTLPGAKLAAVSDFDFGKAKEVGLKYQASFFKDPQEMFPKVDAIIIATPTETHFEIGLFCLNFGKHILIEKPLAKNSNDAQKLVHLANSNNIVLAVGFIERFNPAFQELCKLIKKEKIIGINIHRLSPFPERITDTNVIQDMMIHDLDLLANLLPKDEIESIKAEGEKIKTNNFDKVSATIFFKSGIIAKVIADRIFGIKTRKITITTERALIEADLLNKKIYVRDLQHHIPSIHHTKNFDQLTAELIDFVKAVKTRSQPRVAGQDGYKAQRLAEVIETACS